MEGKAVLRRRAILGTPPSTVPSIPLLGGPVAREKERAIFMPSNLGLCRASRAKKDEFYTQLTDIEKELSFYREHFKGKAVLCNCDDPRVSNFFRFFSLNFEHLGLKRLIATCYKNQNPDLFSCNNCEQAVYQIYEGDKNGNSIPDPEEIGIKPLKGDGDFRKEECIALLKEADIVVTNPPFSLFREYLAQLIEYGKKFLIIGSINAISYKDTFQLFKENRIWLGASIHSGDREFGVPSDYPLNAAGFRVDEKGRKFIRVKGVRWFTNLDYKERHEDLILYKKYSPKEYPKYDNYDAINVDTTKDIPMDYDGLMGVPITFLDKYNPGQFEIIGLDRYVKDNPNYGHRFTINGKETYARILIKARKRRFTDENRVA